VWPLFPEPAARHFQLAAQEFRRCWPIVSAVVVRHLRGSPLSAWQQAAVLLASESAPTASRWISELAA
jgi:hypothetical protein